MAERNPSSVLLSRRAEHSADRAGARAHRDGYRDEAGPEVEGLDRLQWAAVRKDLCALDASACVRRDEAEDVAHLRLEGLAVGDAGKLAGRERGVREQDASYLPERRFVLLAQRDAVAELCTQGAGQSAARSCAARVAAADLQSPAGRPDEAELPQSEAQKKQRPKVAQERMAEPWKPQAARPGAVAEARLQMASG